MAQEQFVDQEKKMEHKQKTSEISGCFCYLLVCSMPILACLLVVLIVKDAYRVPDIEISSMDLTVEKLTQSRFSANWDILVRIPQSLPDDFICLHGDIQTSIFYKNITLVTSSRQRYNDLTRYTPQQLRVSVDISDEDIGGLVGKSMIKDIKDTNEVKFGSQIFLTDCRKGSTGVLRYVCDETTLRYEPGHEKATKFGNNPTCSIHF